MSNGIFDSNVAAAPAVQATGTNEAFGVIASSDTGNGVSATSGSGTGVYAESKSRSGVIGVGNGNPDENAGVFGSGGVVAGVWGSSTAYDGVRGETYSPQHAGVSGSNNGGNEGGYGVFGAGSGAGVYGTGGDSSGTGVYGVGGAGEIEISLGAGGGAHRGPGGNGVMGTTGDGNMSGVIGVNTDGGNGVYGTSISGRAVAGSSPNGTAGWFESTNGAGVVASSGAGDAVHGECTDPFYNGVSGINTGKGNGVYARGTPAGFFQGDIRVTGDLILLNSPQLGDIAEDFDVMDGTVHSEPGTVLVIGSSGRLCASTEQYDTRVAGVVSGAGDLRPAVVLQRIRSPEPRSPIALVGKVSCKVDANFGSVVPGDLLTTSPTCGHAMKVTDRSQAMGAVLGKALAPLETGRGLIPVLVSLR